MNETLAKLEAVLDRMPTGARQALLIGVLADLLAQSADSYDGIWATIRDKAGMQMPEAARLASSVWRETAEYAKQMAGR